MWYHWKKKIGRWLEESMKIGKTKSRMGKSLYIWIRSFLLTLTLISGMLILLTNWMVDSFSDEIMNLNHRLAANIQTGMDIRLNDIDNFMAQLPLNTDNLYLARISSIEGGEAESMIRMSSRLNEYKLSNAFIQEICIYYPKIDYIVGDLGYFPARQYYMLAHDQDDSEYRKWIKDLTSEKNSGYYFQEDSEGELNLYFTKWLPYNGSDEKSAILTLCIHKEEVERILKSDKYAEKNSLNAIAGKDGVIYAFSGDQDKKTWIEDVLQREAGNPYIEIEQYSGSVQQSEFYQLEYVTLYDRKQMLENSSFVRNMAYLSLAVCMILGSMLFWIMGRRNNRPIRNILDKLYIYGDRQPGDEYALIQSGIDTMLANDQISQKKLQEQRNTMEGMFLYNLLSSEERNNSVIFASMQRFNLQFEYSLFQIMALRSKIGFSGEEIKIAIHKIINCVQEKRKEIYVIATEFKGDIVLLLHMESELSKPQEQELSEKILEAVEDVQGGVRLFVGGIYDTMSNIILSYQQVRMLMESAKESRQQIVRFTEDTILPKQEEKPESGIMAEYEMAMLEGNYESAQKQVDRLFNQYIGSDHHVFTARSKKYAVINSLIEALYRMPELDAKQEEYIAELQKARDNQALLQVIHEIFVALTEMQRKRQKSRKEGCTQQAKEYIDLHFEDPMIGLYSISELLGISNTYLSTSFKKQYGLGVVQYINQLRIEKAKKMILNTEYSIKEIAFRVGFTNDITFIRVFKQFENMTPGKYKKDGPSISDLK